MTLTSNSQTASANAEFAGITKPALTATGSNQAGALVIPSGQDMSIFTTVAASTGCILPAYGVGLGEEYCIANHGANALLVYPPVGGYMGSAAQNAGYSLAAGKAGYFRWIGPLQYSVNP